MEASDKTAIVRQIAHELRQPLSAMESIAFYLDLILPRTDEKARAQVERLRKLVDQSNWIVSNAVHYVQASPAVPQSLDLQETITAAASECTIAERVCMTMGEEPIIVRLDPGQAVHLFRSLLSFFGRIVSGQHPLVLAATQLARHTRIVLETSAQGYTSSEVDSMFEAYGAGLPAGAGLMLASVRKIVEAHEGRIEIDADPHIGIRITLVLPN